eukprot:scaffold6072_cov94-Amphora_coffeaeformis.AAC.6
MIPSNKSKSMMKSQMSKGGVNSDKGATKEPSPPSKSLSMSKSGMSKHSSKVLGPFAMKGEKKKMMMMMGMMAKKMNSMMKKKKKTTSSQFSSRSESGSGMSKNSSKVLEPSTMSTKKGKKKMMMGMMSKKMNNMMKKKKKTISSDGDDKGGRTPRGRAQSRSMKSPSGVDTKMSWKNPHDKGDYEDTHVSLASRKSRSKMSIMKMSNRKKSNILGKQDEATTTSLPSKKSGMGSPKSSPTGKSNTKPQQYKGKGESTTRAPTYGLDGNSTTPEPTRPPRRSRRKISIKTSTSKGKSSIKSPTGPLLMSHNVNAPTKNGDKNEDGDSRNPEPIRPPRRSRKSINKTTTTSKDKRSIKPPTGPSWMSKKAKSTTKNVGNGADGASSRTQESTRFPRQGRRKKSTKPSKTGKKEDGEENSSASMKSSLNKTKQTRGGNNLEFAEKSATSNSSPAQTHDDAYEYYDSSLAQPVRSCRRALAVGPERTRCCCQCLSVSSEYLQVRGKCQVVADAIAFLGILRPSGPSSRC